MIEDVGVLVVKVVVGEVATVVVVVAEDVVVVDKRETTNWSCCDLTPLPSGFCEPRASYVPLTVGVNENVQYPFKLLVTGP